MSVELKSGKIKNNSRKKGVLNQAKAQRRKEAEERQAAYDKLTVQQKLAKLDAGGFTATRQRARLTAASK